MKPARVEATAPALPAGRHGGAAIGDYVALAKPRLNLLVVLTSAAGYYLGAAPPIRAFAMAEAVVATALVAGGAAVLNQVYERDTDKLMRRTRMRPLPDGRVTPSEARVWGSALSIAGLVWLALASNVLSAALALATLVVYLIVYTPLKRRSPIATLVGAVPGALPPLIGWTAAHGSAGDGGWTLFAILFLWQIPHFMAIAWMYRDDYGKAGFPMLPVIEPGGRRTGTHAMIYAAALLPVSLLPSLLSIAGAIYFWVALVLGVALLWLAARFAMTRSDYAARRLFFGSITYLPLLMAALVMDHAGR